ncbi:hypothetical protein K9U40_05460 [Xanthobacter autotrophicus]|uniref:hypothetical protein n=1 Tax=Xanthobacter TaxID=279 RepID=UPI0024AA7192|nr:hypothetical protein [Xanthobacter autotrophicus]MDI4663775.1 hypothetical protein [Xanthobacter autotrophicus]
MARILAALALFATLLAGTPWLLPVAKESVKLVAARDDPAALADLGLTGFTAQDAPRSIAEALAEDDAALAASFLALADARGLPIPPELRTQVTEATGALAETMHSARAFGLGFVTGEPRDPAGLAGAAASDLMVWGDIRDAGREGLKLARGEDADELILGLSAVGIAVTAGTYATVGASLPVRIGISLVKVARRTGRLSASLARSFTRAVHESVDFFALRRLAAAPSSVDAAAVKGVIRTERLTDLTRLLDDAARIEAKAGTRAALEGLKVADNGRDLARVARLAEAKGSQTLAILKTLGRGAIAITGALFHLIWWAFAAALYAFALVSSFNSLCVACARRCWRGKRPKMARHRHKTPEPAQAAAMPPAAPAGIEAATARVLAAVEAARELARSPSPAHEGAEPAAPSPPADLAQQERASTFPPRHPPRSEAPPVAVPREGPPCPISLPQASISPISTSAPAIRSS